MLTGIVLMRIWFPLSPHFDHLPQFDIRSFSPSLLAGLGYGLLLLILFATLGVAFQQSQQLSSPLRFHFILITTFLFGLILLNTYPINATDIYRYVIRGRVSSIHGQNQYEVPPNRFANDPFASFAGEWAGETSPYGPVWELVATAVTARTKDNLLAGLVTFKVIGLLAHLGSTALIWQLLSKRGANHRAGLTLLWAWNPALLLTFIVNAHNDSLMIFWMLLGYWLGQRPFKIVGTLLFMVAALTKPIALLAVPLYFVAAWRSYSSFSQRFRFAITVGVGSLLLIWLAFLPFGSPLDLFFRLVRESTDGGGFSIPALLLLLNHELGGSLPGRELLIAGQLLFGICALWLFWRTWNGRSPLHGITDIFAAYVLQALKFRLWYATWLFPWALIEGEANGRLSQRTKTTLYFLITTQFSALIYGHLRIYVLAGNYLWAHLIGVPFTFALPLLLPKIINALHKHNSPPPSILHNS
ncbi:MAG: DUF2029 domain-containing protein [Chloroflexi bacterium]|nr:DUF2029 domain-containing protein [Chloroflexota bacterium]